MRVLKTAAGPSGRAPVPARINNKKISARSRGRMVVASARPSETEEERTQRFKSVFTQQKEMDVVTGAAASMATPIFYGVSAIAAAAAALGGFVAGSQAPSNLRTPVSVAGAGAGAVAVALGAKSVKAKRDGGAGVEVWNAFVSSENPVEADPAVLAAITTKYGADFSPERAEAVKSAYAAYLGVLIPPGDIPLRGDEHELLRALLDKIGLPDEEAAMCHTDVGRNLFRARLEVSGRDAQFDELRAFQKLIYVSTQLFGELKAQYLTPWVARFGVTPEQVSVAKRNGAKTVMQGRIEGAFGGKVPATLEAVKTLREIQLQVKLADEDCAGVIKDLLAAEVDIALKDAVKLMRTRGASIDYRPAVTAMDNLLDLSRKYTALAATGGTDVVPGIGPLTVKGTSFAYGSENDILDLWRLFLKTKMEEAGNALTAATVTDLNELRVILNAPERKTLDIQGILVSDAYTALLREAVKSGRMDESESPAQVLDQLITQVSMPGELAVQLHDSMYRDKLESCVRDGVISDDDSTALQRTARLLCIPEERVAAVDSEVKGRLFRATLRSAINAGIDVFGRDQTDAVKDAKRALRLSSEDAFAALDSLAKADLIKMINAARTKASKIENARALRSVVYFSNIILAPLVAICKGDADKEAAMKEFAETIAKAKAEADEEEAAEKAAADKVAADKAAAEAKAESAAPAEEGAEAKAEGAEAAKADEAAAPEASTSDAAAEESPADGQPASLAKADKAAKERADGETITTDEGKEVAGSSQKEITVADDFSKADRLDTYKTYLIFCMTGDVVELPMGGSIAVERDETEFARLSQLGDILGLTQFDVYEVHSDMAEQAFKSQAESLTGGGAPNKQTKEKLDKMAKEMGLPDATAQKIIRGISNKKLVGNLQGMRAAGELTLDKVLQLVEQDIDVKDILPDMQRMVLYAEHIEMQLGSGEGAIDTEYLLEKLPEKLALDSKAAVNKAKALSKSKVRTTMVQAVSYLRQNQPKETFKYLNNLMACARVAGGDLAGAAKWKSSEEVLDLYGTFCARSKDDASRAELAKALEISKEDATTVRGAVDAGTFGKAGASSAAGDTEDSSDSLF